MVVVTEIFYGKDDSSVLRVTVDNLRVYSLSKNPVVLRRHKERIFLIFIERSGTP